MHHITKVEIEGFWDSYDFGLQLFPEVTFLIGTNGTGKTTLINLLAAALTADFQTLDRIPFRKIVVFLTPTDKKEIPKITITKTKKGDRPIEQLEYKIHEGGANVKEIKFSLEQLEEQLTVRNLGNARRIPEYYRRMSLGIIPKLRELVQVNWLSVHRTVTSDRSREERVSYESSVDQRLESISTDLARFFATLSRQKDDEVRSFQESIFISLLDEPGGLLFDIRPLDRLDEFISSLISIFKELHISEQTTGPRLSSYMDKANFTKQKFVGSSEQNRAFDSDDVTVLLGLRRIASAVDRWKELQRKLAQVFSTRDRWVRITNDLLRRKKMEITDSNELIFVSRTGKHLTPQMLSSGEKQLLILLSETLLQREQPAIYIADEPELSLHVTWQESLVASLRALNPSAQIIAATHSPDIVGGLSDRVIDMESLIP